MIDLTELEALAPAGSYIAIRVGFAFPMVEHNRLPSHWVREYTISGLIVHDPAMAWAYKNRGVARWSELGEPDLQGVLQLARNHNLTFGAVASCVDESPSGQRSFGFFLRSDREYSTPELESLHTLLKQEHLAYAQPTNITAAELATLSLVKNGLLMKQIACILGVSESAVKQRLKNVRLKLNAKTGTQAAARATMLGMI